MNRVYLILLIFVFAITGSVAQTKHIAEADKLFATRDYVGAVKGYRKALKNTDNINEQQRIAGKIALAYYNMNDYSNASDWFEDAIGDNSANIDTYLDYSQALLVERRFQEAMGVLQKAIIAYPDNFEIELRIDAVNMILKNNTVENNGITKVVELSSDNSDYGIGFWDNSIVFSSTRSNGSSRIDGRTGQGFSDLYVCSGSDGDFGSVKLMSAKLNSSQNDGTFSFDPVNSIAYWTVCSGKPGSCKIFSSKYSTKKGWSKPEKLSFMNNKYSYGHPFICGNGNILYFTSNMIGGYGGNDIWKVTRKEDGFWGVPVNLGKNINSSTNEMFPSVYNDTVLFFASNSSSSYGGLDIFFSVKKGVEFTEAVNVGLPVNSAADDFNLLLKQDGRGGFFCSNRDIETSDDIYSFAGFPIKINLSGVVVHEVDNKPVDSASVVIINNDGECDSLWTDENGSYDCSLSVYNKYRIIVKKTGYFKEEKVIDTDDDSYIFSGLNNIYVDFSLIKKKYPCGIKGVVTDKESGIPMSDIQVEITGNNGFSSYTNTDIYGVYIFEELKPNTIYSVKTGKIGYFSESRVCRFPDVQAEEIYSKKSGYDMDFQLLKIQKEKEVTLSNIYYDYNKATLRESSKIELDKLVSMLYETPNVMVQISAHTDSRGRPEYNMELSAKRAASVVNYLINNGIERSRLNAKGYGETRLLIVDASTEDEHQANRRTTFQVTGSDYNVRSTSINTSELSYHVQLVTSSNQKNVEKDFVKITSQLNDIRIFEVVGEGLYKYEAGTRYSFSDARKLMKKLRRMGYNDCFVVSYVDGEKIPVSQALNIEGGR